MRFALFVTIAALALVSVNAWDIEFAKHHISAEHPNADFKVMANGQAPTSQWIGFINGLAMGGSVANVTSDVIVYNQINGGGNATTTLKAVQYGEWREYNLGADSNIPQSVSINSVYLNASGYAGNNVNTGISTTTPITFHYSLGFLTAYNQQPRVDFITISDSNLKTSVNASSSLLSIVNLVDNYPAAGLYIGIRNNSQDTNPVFTTYPNAYWLSPFWFPGTGSLQIQVSKDSASTSKPLVDWKTFNVGANQLAILAITGSVTTTDGSATAFPVSVNVGKSASLSGNSASTMAVSFALMALLAILGYATPALF
jgi:hypothetical protein